jgi:hypothetical protein
VVLGQPLDRIPGLAPDRHELHLGARGQRRRVDLSGPAPRAGQADGYCHRSTIGRTGAASRPLAEQSDARGPVLTLRIRHPHAPEEQPP